MLAVGSASRLDPRDSVTATDDEEALASPLNGVEELGEPTSRVCRSKPSHKNQIIR